MIAAEAVFDGRSSELCVEGHAGYAEHGKDIVCAGVSALCGSLWARLASLESLGVIAVTDLGPKGGGFCCKLTDIAGSYGRSAVEQTAEGIRLIADKYPEHVFIKREYR